MCDIACLFQVAHMVAPQALILLMSECHAMPDTMRLKAGFIDTCRYLYHIRVHTP